MMVGFLGSRAMSEDLSGTQFGPPSPFNGAVECGIRVLVLLRAAYPSTCDRRRLVVYDYILLHSSDVPEQLLSHLNASGKKPASLHPATPYRGGELLVRRESIAGALRLMMRKGLIVPNFSKDGITYAVTELARSFLGVLESDYTRDLTFRAEWLVPIFSKLSDDELSLFATDHLRDWGGEFVNESVWRGWNP
jgi:hypothetical protein